MAHVDLRQVKAEIVNLERERGLRRPKYGDHLASAQWQTAKRFALELAGHRCQVCNCPHDLHVHHRHYRNLGRETHLDLTVLCRRCHSRHHDLAA